MDETANIIEVGTVSIVACGKYSQSKLYDRLSVIEYNGESYIAKKSNKNIIPDSIEASEIWQKLVSKPKKGIDYLTEDDIKEIIDEIADNIDLTETNNRIQNIENEDKIQDKRLDFLEHDRKYGEAEGENHITITDGALAFANILEETEIEVEGEKRKAYVVNLPQGLSKQEQREGYNLFDAINSYPETHTKTGITFTKNSDGTFNAHGTATEDTSINLGTDLIGLEIIPGKEYSLYSNIPYNTNTFNLSLTYGGEGMTNKFILANSSKILDDITQWATLNLYIPNGQTINVDNVKVMICNGAYDSSKLFEQYGETPSIEFPSEIENVKAWNLFDKSNVINDFFVTDKPISNNSWCYYETNLKIGKNYIPNSRIIISFFNGEQNIRYIDTTKTFSVPEDTTKVFISIEKNNLEKFMLTEEKDKNKPYAPYGAVSIGLENKNTSSLEEGETATSYTENQEQNYNLHLGDLELNGMGEIRDSFVVELDSLYSYKKIKKLYLNKKYNKDLFKNLTWIYENSSKRAYTAILEKVIKKVSTNNNIANIMSNTYKKASTSDIITGLVDNSISVSTLGYISLINKNFNSLEDYTNSFNKNNNYFIYELETPELIDLTEDYPQLVEDIENILNNISTYEEETNIETDIGFLKIEYVKADDKEKRIEILEQENKEKAKKIKELEDEIDVLNADYKSNTQIGENTVVIPDGAPKTKISTQIDGNSYQETTEGYNKIGKATLRNPNNGVTLTNNEDGSFTLNGTSTASIYIDFEIDIKEAGDYKVAFNKNQLISSFGGDVRFIIYNENTKLDDTSLINKTNYLVTFEEDNLPTSANLWLNSGNTFNNFTFYPSIIKGTEDKPYEPYTNGASPNPEYEQDIEVIDGVNRFNKNSSFENGYLDITNGAVIKGAGWKVTEYIKIPDNIATISLLNAWGKNESHCFYDEKKNFVAGYGMGTNLNVKIPVKSNYKYARFTVNLAEHDNFMIAFGNYDSYIPYGHIGLIQKGKHLEEYKEKIYPINLNGNTLSKVGDVKDLLKIGLDGIVTLEKKTLNIIAELQAVEFENDLGYRLTKTLTEDTQGTEILSNKFKYNLSAGNSNEYGLRINSDLKTLVGLAPNLSVGDIVETEVYLQRAKVENINLPSIEPIKLFDGTNTFELITNLGTTMAVEYKISHNKRIDDLEETILKISESQKDVEKRLENTKTNKLIL